MAAVGVASQRFIAPPALAVEVLPHVIVLVAVGFVPRHPELPVTVSAAVNDPLATVGVKVATAGLIFCTQFPNPPPPDQVAALNDPVAVAPVIVKAARGVASQRFKFAPAPAVGVCPHVITRVEVGLVPAQPSLPVTVRVAVNEPLVTVGVNVARAGLTFCVQLPNAPPPVQFTAL
jgi:hypothetical protein